MNILFICPIHWGYLRQRYQQIALGLAKRGNKIFYLQFTRVDLSFFTNLYRLSIDSILPIKKISEKLIVLNIFLPPFATNESFALSNIIIAFLKLYMRYLRFKPDVAIFFAPRYVSLLQMLNFMGTKVIYDCADELSGFSHIRGDVKLLQQEKYLAVNCSFIIVTSKVLYNKFLKINPKCFYVPNGVDFDHFFTATKLHEKIPETEHLRHPVIGYIGAIFEWFNADLVCKLAELHPDYSILLVGPMNFDLKKKVEKYSNIRIVGTKPYDVLPQYLACMDVCLIPFKINKLSLASNPIKLYEYLAAGKPVVSTALPEICEKASELVYIAKDEEDFIRKVEEAVEETKSTNKEVILKRVNFAKENTWQKRVETIEKLLRNL